MSPVGLEQLLSRLPKKADANLLVGFDTSDDAGIYRLDDERALVVTADIITPPVDDPVLFGQIAAANALSDVYAVGGRPLTCLNLVGFPVDSLGPEVLAGIVEGALAKITEAEAVLAGGHTTDDEEPKFGLAVTGLVHPDKYWSNAGARPGDALVLTKPVGSGVLFNANLRGWVSEAALDACVQVLCRLNKTAAEVLEGFEVHAATDVTGFGLAGHTVEMARASQVCVRLRFADVPLMDEAVEMYGRGVKTGMNAPNRQVVEEVLRLEADLSPEEEQLLVDPQTSGGLLVALPADQAEAAVAALIEAGVEHATLVGEAVALDGPVHLAVV